MSVAILENWLYYNTYKCERVYGFSAYMKWVTKLNQINRTSVSSGLVCLRKKRCERSDGTTSGKHPEVTNALPVSVFIFCTKCAQEPSVTNFVKKLKSCKSDIYKIHKKSVGKLICCWHLCRIDLNIVIYYNNIFNNILKTDNDY